MHAFDLERLSGHGRSGSDGPRPGERVRTLDGQDRALQPDMLVIADDTRAQAVAGVMGGADSEVSDATRRIALESAYFPSHVGATDQQAPGAQHRRLVPVRARRRCGRPGRRPAPGPEPS